MGANGACLQVDHDSLTRVLKSLQSKGKPQVKKPRATGASSVDWPSGDREYNPLTSNEESDDYDSDATESCAD
jgi:hypothetical protein